MFHAVLRRRLLFALATSPAFERAAPKRRAWRSAGRRLQIGAEEAAVTDRVIELVVAAARAGRPVEATLQANLRRSPGDAERLAAAGVPVRLVKGAYVEDGGQALVWGAETDRVFV